MDVDIEITEAPDDYSTPLVSRIFKSIPEVYDRLFDVLPAADLCQVRKLSRDARIAVQAYEQYTFSPNKLLRRFFYDPLGFRSLQARTGTLISGSQALQLLGRCRWPDSDLDIYVWKESALEVCAWIKDEGYTYKPLYFQTNDLEQTLKSNIYQVLMKDPVPIDQLHEDEAEEILEDIALYNHNSISNVINFEKDIGSKVLKTQVVIAKYSPLEMILSFHSSASLCLATVHR